MSDTEHMPGKRLGEVLLASLSIDKPSDAARRAAADALGLAPPPPPTNPGPGAGGPGVAAGRPFFRWPSLTLLATAALVSGALVTRHLLTEPPRREPTVTPTAPPVAKTTPVYAPEVVPEPVVPTKVPAHAPAKRPIRAQSVEQPPVRQVVEAESPAPKVTGDDLSSLAAETTLVDAARSALRRKQPGTALRLLSRHESEFPSGVLRNEATALRIEARFQSGDRAAATIEAQQFLIDHPGSALANRVRALVETENP